MYHKIASFLFIVILTSGMSHGAYAGNPSSLSQQEGFAELAIGEWLGQGLAGGETFAESPGINISGFGDFTANMEFLVPQSGSLEGSWTLEGESFWGMNVNTSVGEVKVEVAMVHSADGDITGNRSEFSLGVTQIESDITITGDFSDTARSSDPLGPIDLLVSGIYCNDAWGEWILSWNTELGGAGYTPTFDGEWYSIRQDPEFSEEHIAEILDTTDEFNNEVNDIFQSASTLGGIPIIPFDSLWELLYQGVQLQNEARNLSPCDRALLGEDQYEQWIYGLTHRVAALGANLLAIYDLNGRPIDGFQLADLSFLLGAAGALGEGSLIDTSSLETALEADIAEILTTEGHDVQEQASALITAEHFGLEIPEGIDPSSILPGWGE